MRVKIYSYIIVQIMIQKAKETKDIIFIHRPIGVNDAERIWVNIVNYLYRLKHFQIRIG